MVLVLDTTVLEHIPTLDTVLAAGATAATVAMVADTDTTANHNIN